MKTPDFYERKLPIRHSKQNGSGSNWLEDHIYKKKNSLSKKQNIVKLQIPEGGDHTFQSVCDALDLPWSSEALLNISRKLDISAVLCSTNFSLYPVQNQTYNYKNKEHKAKQLK